MSKHDRETGGEVADCAATAAAFGLAEWALGGGFGLGLPFAQAQRSLPAVVLVYAVTGGAIGALLGRRARGADDAPRAVPATVALLLTALAAQEALAHSRVPATLSAGLLVLAALGLGLVAHRLGVAALGRAPALGRASTCWSVAGALWIAAELAMWPAMPDGTSRVVVAASVLAALVALALGLRAASGGLALAGLLPLALASGFLGLRLPDAPLAGEARANAPSVLLVTIDTLRADHVGAYGRAAARTPHMDELARQGTLFRQVVSHNVFTGPSHTSILTGLLPEHHGVLLNEVRVPDRVATLPEILLEAGWISAAFIGGYTTTDASVGLPSRFGYHDDDLRAFRLLPTEVFRLALLRPLERLLARAGFEVSLRWPLYRPADGVTDSALAWLDQVPSAPFFLWAHYFDPHLPYVPPPRHLTERERAYEGPVSGRYFRLTAAQRGELVSTPADVTQMIGLYDAEVAFADEQLGRLVAGAREASGARGLLIVVTSDHGESMGEHGLFWNRDLYDPSLLVPLIVVEPGEGGAGVPEVAAQVRLIDVAPSLLDLLGVVPPEGLDGRSFAALLHGEPDPAPRPAHSGVYRYADSFYRASFSVRADGWKLLSRPAGWRGGNLGAWLEGDRELYDLAADPGEEHDLASDRPERAEQLEQELRALGRDDGSVHVELEPEVRDLLRGLGYTR